MYGGFVQVPVAELENEELHVQLGVIRQDRMIRRRMRSTRSRLDPFRAEIMELRRAGASLAEIQMWLRTKRRTKVHRMTIQRRIKKWLG